MIMSYMVCILAVVFLVTHIINLRIIRRLKDSLEQIDVEQSKISFRLFIIEKRAKMNYENEIR